MEEIPEKKSTFQGLRVAVPEVSQERKIFQLSVVPMKKEKPTPKTPEELKAIVNRVSKKMQEDKRKEDSKQAKEVQLLHKPKLDVQNLKRKIMGAKKGVKIQVIEAPRAIAQPRQQVRVQKRPTKPVKRACYETPKSKEFISESSEDSDEESAKQVKSKIVGKPEETKPKKTDDKMVENEQEDQATGKNESKENILQEDLALSESEEEPEERKDNEKVQRGTEDSNEKEEKNGKSEEEPQERKDNEKVQEGKENSNEKENEKIETQEEKQAKEEQIKWKLIPMEDISVPTPKRDWIQEKWNARNKEMEEKNLKVHPDDPRFNARCKKCRERFHYTKECTKEKKKQP
ncbi:ABC transporter F family member 4-like [Frankliniella occidentalis]|uniref:ABC transporter F family member 4-like n=1 Tax=Frankliniella occidentalis TaxID=133901 RepID=A0A6J1T5Y3_FRAOC|nr:ABC transporter F family member 4-like [Frankliniella occidentalis]